MVVKCILPILMITLIQVSVFSQTFEAKFADAWESDDTSAQKILLDQWETKEPDNPEFYVSAFNFYFRNSKQEVLNFGRETDGEPVLELKDTKTGKTAGFVSSKLVFEPENLNKALSYIGTGIQKFPDRLDMRFGQVFVLKETGDFEQMTSKIVATVDRSAENKNRWFWRKGEPIEEPQEFMLGNIQTYVGIIFDAGPEKAEFIRQIAAAVLKYFPKDVRYMSNLAVFHLLRKEYSEALVPLLKAERIAPEDPVILGNIAYSYFEKGDQPNAIVYYRKFYRYGDEAAKLQARAA